MDYQKTMEKLEQLFDIAVEIKDANAGLRVVEAMIRSGAAQAEAKPADGADNFTNIGHER